MPEELRFLARCYRSFELSLDPDAKVLWCSTRPEGPSALSPIMAGELMRLSRSVQRLCSRQAPSEEPPIRYAVRSSRVPGIYSTGGDLPFLVRCIRAGDEPAIRRYARGCMDVLYHVATGFGARIITVGLLQGAALGGGFESALACQVLIAERSARLGFPALLSGAFPDLGASTFLRQRLNSARTEQLLWSGKVYSADEMHEMGIVDRVVEDGRGEDAVREYVTTDRPSHAVRRALVRVRQRVNPIELPQLREAAERWADRLVRLPPAAVDRLESLEPRNGR